MSYATSDDLAARFGATELDQLADRNGDGLPDDGVVQGALADADAEIDAYLAGRYPLPLAHVPPVLARIACDMVECKRLRWPSRARVLTDLNTKADYRAAHYCAKHWAALSCPLHGFACLRAGRVGSRKARRFLGAGLSTRTCPPTSVTEGLTGRQNCNQGLQPCKSKPPAIFHGTIVSIIDHSGHRWLTARDVGLVPWL